jgi:hypothetical protein
MFKTNFPKQLSSQRRLFNHRPSSFTSCRAVVSLLRLINYVNYPKSLTLSLGLAIQVLVSEQTAIGGLTAALNFR